MALLFWGVARQNQTWQSLKSSTHALAAARGQRDAEAREIARQARLLEEAGRAYLGTSAEAEDFAWGLAYLAAALACNPNDLLAAEIAIFRLNECPGTSLQQVLAGHTDYIADAHFSHDGSRVVTASADGTARVWDTGSGSPLLTLAGHDAKLRSAEFSPDGRQVLTASADGTARVWDAHTGASLAALSGHNGWVRIAHFSPDGRRILTAASDGTVRLWDTAGSGELFKLVPAEGSMVAKFSRDGRRVVAASTDGGACIWDAENGRLLVTLREQDGQLVAAEFSPDGTRIVTASEAIARIWDARSGGLLATLGGPLEPLSSAHFSDDGSRIVMTCGKGVRVWDGKTGGLAATIDRWDYTVYSARFSPGGRTVVTGMIGEEGSRSDQIGLWDARTGKLLAKLGHQENRITDVKFSRDGRHMVNISQGDAAVLWEAPGDIGPAPAWFSRLLELAAASRINGEGEVERLSALYASMLRLELESVSAHGSSRYLEITRWFLADPGTRPMRPGMVPSKIVQK